MTKQYDKKYYTRLCNFIYECILNWNNDERYMKAFQSTDNHLPAGKAGINDKRMKNHTKSIIYFILFLFISAKMAAQTIKYYDEAWQKVEDSLAKGLPATALNAVKEIYSTAMKDNQEAQIVKALVYMNSLQEENRENNLLAGVGEIESKLPGSSVVVKALLNSYLAGLYQQYFSQNRYKFYNRSATQDFSKADPATWSIDDFVQKISNLYLASINDKKLLQQTDLNKYEAIIQKGNARFLRPTLYDLLAHRALQYFMSSETEISKPSYVFEINQQDAFAPARQFITTKFETKDSLSLKVKALGIFQDLLSLHINDPQPDALIDADLLRLSFVKNNAVLTNKDALYASALKHLIQTHGNIPAAKQVKYLLAAYYNEIGNKLENEYAQKDSARKNYLLSKKLINEVLATPDSTEGSINANNLKNTLLKPSFKFEIEKVNLPNQPFRLFATYKNIPSLYLRIIPVTEVLMQKYLSPEKNETFWETFRTAKSSLETEQPIPAINDLVTNHTELKVDALPAGEYFLLTSINKNFSSKENILGLQKVYISNIAFVNEQNNFFVLNRETGVPLNNASVKIRQREYNYNNRKYTYTEHSAYTTDKNGYFHFSNEDNSTTKKRNNNNNYQLDITYKGERLYINDEGNNYYYFNNYMDADDPFKYDDPSLFLFTDRSIYRPGQTVYFKGILIRQRNDGKKSELVTNHKSTVEFLDPNNQTIDSVALTTNEYGSFSGAFKIPEGRMNGSFTLSSDDGEVSIRVEEYKRPKYYAEFEKVKGAYQLNEQINVQGFAKAYAGNMVDGATVNYRVERITLFPYPWLIRIIPPRGNNSMQITSGTTTTDAQGKFNINFSAIPDQSVDPATNPIFNYKIYADITDINGEVRSCETLVAAAYRSIVINTSLPAKIEADSLHRLWVRTENLSGEFEKAPVQISIKRLKPENRLLRKRLWDIPDTFAFTKEEYIRFFPNDIYNDEDEPSSWPTEKTYLNQIFETDSSGIIKLPIIKYAPGQYAIEFTIKDKDSTEIKDLKYIEIINSSEKKLSTPAYLWTKAALSAEPGEKVETAIGTSSENVFLIIHNDKNSNEFSFTQLNNEIKTFKHSVTENDRGGYSVGYAFIKNNRFYEYTDNIQVPWTNKQLQLSFETFRDKTQPGAEEEWQVNIKGSKGEKIAAEMLASMYDASLDQFSSNQWDVPALWNNFYNSISWDTYDNFTTIISSVKNSIQYNYQIRYRKQYDNLLLNNSLFALQAARLNSIYDRIPPAPGESRLDEVVVTSVNVQKKVSYAGSASTIIGYGKPKQNQHDENMSKSFDNAQNTRTNFNETAFFFPDLKTDKEGNISFSFKMPESLTRWKFQGLAHSKDLAFGYLTNSTITQKDLMVQPNMPRFLREGDEIILSSKIVNLSAQDISGNAVLELINPTTNEPIDELLKNLSNQQTFNIKSGQSVAVAFPVRIPVGYNAPVTWRIKAATDGKSTASLSDGEENVLPVLSNRMLVTESLPLQVRGSGTKNFKFEKLLNSGQSNTLTTQSLTVEYSSNPVWYAVQALPYMMEYPYECAEQTWNRYYANSLATMVANSSPKIKAIFDKWRTTDTAALLSNLQKNEELKAILLEETPWVLAAKSETQQKKNIGVLFDLTRMSNEINSTYEKLKQLQSDNGGFVWFKGGPDDRYITQYIVTGIGHLKKIDGIQPTQHDNINNILNKAIPYLDARIKNEYDELIAGKANMDRYSPSYYVIQYLYMRSFFPEISIAKNAQIAVNYFRERASKSWVQQNKYMQGMIAIALFRNNNTATPTAILKSLKETAINNEELGMYYKDAQRGWWWYQAPIERQAVLIEAFEEIANDHATADDMRTWLLKNKQTNNWESTKATAEACYALLLKGSDWLGKTPEVAITLGDYTIDSKNDITEAGTGYLKHIIDAKNVKADMGNVTVRIEQPSATASTLPIWGSVYWQYFENLDKITSAETPLQLAKKLFIETNNDRGPVLTPISDVNTIKIGDKIKVRIELHVDRDMEYVHMKDMRASGFEPVNVLSQYKWQGGLGYYESTKDASTNFFFNNLRKGTYVFEYNLFATIAGKFSNGITSIQCMYAPEFSSHSEGIRVNVSR